MAGIPIESIATAGDNFRICMPDQSLSGSKNITLQVMRKLRGFAINLLTFLDYEEFLKANVCRAFHIAVNNGMVEFVIEVLKARPYVNR
uniref:Uncharacterized protein n=1 Tax=Salix viminalis TaxID=40686 RepID=A0A6N2M5E7_SALVM